MMARRRCFNTTERLAAAYLAVPGLVSQPLRSSGSAKQIAAPQKTRKGNAPLPCDRHSGWKKPLGSFISIRRER